MILHNLSLLCSCFFKTLSAVESVSSGQKGITEGSNSDPISIMPECASETTIKKRCENNENAFDHKSGDIEWY